jgi:hypothetical protein
MASDVRSQLSDLRLARIAVLVDMRLTLIAVLLVIIIYLVTRIQLARRNTKRIGAAARKRR